VAQIEFVYAFTVPERTPYTLAGSFPTSYQGSSVIELWGPDGWVAGRDSSWEGPFSFSAQLDPGEYRISGLLNVNWSFVGNNGGHAGESYEFVLSIPPACPCDWNSDEVVNSNDFFSFLDDFFTSNADFNSDGVTNSQDFFDFLGCFFAPPGGCV
jgi:hypothetical protein